MGGKLGQIGGRLIDSTAKKMADEFFTAFNAALTGPELPIIADSANMAHQAGPKASPGSGALIRPEPESFAGGFKPELYRVFWFSFGAAFTLMITRWIA